MGWAASRAGLVLLVPLLLGASPPQPTGSLDVEVAGLRSAKGMLRFCLAREAAAFPDCKKGQAIERSATAGAAAIRFEGLAPGDYALAVIHDENSNARLDTFVGIPREGFGFSRNPKIGFGPPRFDAASFAVGAGGVRQQVRMRYLL